MGAGLEGFFSGLVQGVGETKLSLEKEKRERKERDDARKLQVITDLMGQPGLKPEQKSDLFRMALEMASGGDKKVVDGMHSILGPVLSQQQGDSGQTGGVRPESPQGGGGVSTPPVTQPLGGGGSAPTQAITSSTPSPSATLPSSPLPKLGSSGSGGQRQNIFYSPEEENQQLAQRAGMVAKATGQVDVDMYRQKLGIEADQRKQEGFKLSGFTQPDVRTGLVTPVYVNELSQQVKYGAPVDPFTSLEAGRAIEVNKAQIALAREEGVNAILRGKGIDPQKATPEQRKTAEEGYAKTVLEEQQVDIQGKKANAFQSIAAGTAALDKSLEKEQLDLNKQALDYNRQRDDYDKIGQQIRSVVDQVEASKAEASEAFNQAMVIKNFLEQSQVDPNGKDVPEDQEAVKAGYTPQNYQLLLGKARAALSKARNLAAAAGDQFKGSVEAGNLDDTPGKWPYLKDTRQPFTYQPIGGQGFPQMPSSQSMSEPPPLTPGVMGKNKPRSQRKSQQIDVPDSLLRDLGLRP